MLALAMDMRTPIKRARSGLAKTQDSEMAEVDLDTPTASPSGSSVEESGEDIEEFIEKLDLRLQKVEAILAADSSSCENVVLLAHHQWLEKNHKRLEEIHRQSSKDHVELYGPAIIKCEAALANSRAKAKEAKAKKQQ